MIRSSLTSVAAVILLVSAADAQVKPFAVAGSGPAPGGLSIFGAPSLHKASGVGTAGLGSYTGEGAVLVQSFDPSTLTGTFKGRFTFVASNGDKLACTYGDTTNGAQQVAQFQLFPTNGGKVVAVFLAEFNPKLALCTGKFAKVVGGSFLMLAVSEPFALTLDGNGFSPPFDYSWAGLGWLEFGKK